MNLLHRWYCRSGGWARQLQGDLMPWALQDIDIGEDVLEIGPGPGLSTDWLLSRVRRLTTIEIDHRLAEALRKRLAGINATVVRGDGTAMPFDSESFSAAVCFTMLHHVPSPELQDRLLTEAHRVLRPGGMLAGADSIPNLVWNLAHLFDTRVPVDPDKFGSRLEATGFADVLVEKRGIFFRFAARKP